MNATKKRITSEQLQQRIDRWGSAIASCRTQARDISPELRVGIQSEIDHLESGRRRVLERLEILTGLDSRDWEELDADVDEIDRDMAALESRLGNLPRR